VRKKTQGTARRNGLQGVKIRWKQQQSQKKTVTFSEDCFRRSTKKGGAEKGEISRLEYARGEGWCFTLRKLEETGPRKGGGSYQEKPGGRGNKVTWSDVKREGHTLSQQKKGKWEEIVVQNELTAGTKRRDLERKKLGNLKRGRKPKRGRLIGRSWDSQKKQSKNSKDEGKRGLN